MEFKLKILLISLKESESLIFNKLLIIPLSRLTSVKKRSKDFSVKLNMDTHKVFELRENLIILSSALISFEVPKDDLNLFRNHYHIPIGKIRTEDVKVKDVAITSKKGGVQSNISFNDDNDTLNFKLENYKWFRNALTSTLIASVSSHEKFMAFKELIKFIEDNPIVYATLEPQLQLGDFEKIEIPGNYSVGLERLIGVLKSIKDAVVQTNLELDKASLGKWIKNIVSARPTDNKSFFDTLIICNPNYPKDWDGYKSFFFSLLFFAFAKDEVAHTNKGFPLELGEKLALNDSEIRFWNAFFKGLFSEKVTNIYISASLKDLQFYCELLAFRKSQLLPLHEGEIPLLDDILNVNLPLNYGNPSREEQQTIANEFSALVEQNPKTNTTIVTNTGDVLLSAPTPATKTIKSNRLLLFSYTKDFRITPVLKRFWILSSNNSKTKTLVIINEIDKTKEDIFSLEFQKLLRDFKERIAEYTEINIEILIVKNNQENYNDLLRNLKKIYADNKLKNTKDIFVLDNFADPLIPQKIIEAIPNTIFWDEEKSYHYLKT